MTEEEPTWFPFATSILVGVLLAFIVVWVVR